MYGINLLEVARILGAVTTSNLLFSNNGFIQSVYQEIIKFSAEKNIEMVRVMINTLARQNNDAYNEMVNMLTKSFSPEELREIFPK